MSYDLSEAASLLQRTRKAQPAAAAAAALVLLDAVKSAMNMSGYPTTDVDTNTFSVTLPGGSLVVRVNNDKFKMATIVTGPWVNVSGISYVPDEDQFVGDGRGAVIVVVERALAVAGK